jgi:hypothetical protein
LTGDFLSIFQINTRLLSKDPLLVLEKGLNILGPCGFNIMGLASENVCALFKKDVGETIHMPYTAFMKASSV